MRRRHSAAFKTKVALEAIKGENTIVEIGSKYGLHPNQIGQWRKEVLNRLPKFTKGRQKSIDKATEELQAELYQFEQG